MRNLAYHLAEMAMNCLIDPRRAEPKPTMVYARFYNLEAHGPENQKFIAFYVSKDDLEKMSSTDLDEKYISPAMSILLRDKATARVTDRALATPSGVIDCAVAVRHRMALRVVVDEYVTSKANEALPEDWCYLSNFYDINNDTLTKQMVCRMIRIDVPV